MNHNSYVSGTYDQGDGFEKLDAEVVRLNQKNGKAYRLFYLALPPSVYTSVTKNIHTHCMAQK